MFDLGPQFTCLTNPFVCAGTWLDGLPFLYVFLAGGVVGMILGAILGRVGTAAVLTLGIGFLIWRKVEGDEPAYETGEPEPKPKPKKPRRTIFGN